MQQKGVPSKNRTFKHPDEMWEAFLEYKNHLIELGSEKGEWKKTHFVGRDGLEKHEKMIIPMTRAGFVAYYYDKYKRNITPYFANQRGNHDEFIEVVEMIRATIKDKQVVGGMLGHYNASITARLNNLHDTQNVNHGTIDSIEIKIVK